MKKQISVQLILLVIGLVIAFTPYYAVSYIVICCLAALHIRLSRIFSSYFSRLILAFLILATAIMISGLGTWALHIPLYPIVAIATFVSAVAVLRITQRGDAGDFELLDAGDLISLSLALVAPLIIIFSFYVPHPTNAATYQFLSTGWDNGSHINMLQNDSNNHGYTYGKGSSTEVNNSLDRARAYPQGWHLATENIADGFNLNPFNASTPIRLMNYYLIIYLLWYIVAVYCFTRVVWSLASRLLPRQRMGLIDILIFALPCLLIQLVAYYGAIVHGFANYIGCMAFIAVLFAFISEIDERNRVGLYIASLLFTIAVTLSWLLPLPAVALALFIAFFPSNIKQHIAAGILNRKHLLLSLATLLTLLIVLGQALIFKLFTQAEDPQINAGSLAGTFPISPLLVLIVGAVSTLYLRMSKRYFNQFAAIVAPFVILTTAVYVYQIFTVGITSYYFGKILALTLLAIGVFFVPAFVSLASSLHKSQLFSSLSLLGISAAFIGLVIIGTSQDTTSFNYLFQRNSKVTYSTSEAIVEYLKNDDPAQTKLVVMRHEKRAEDDNGYMHNLLANMQLTCANHVTGSTVLRIQLHNLISCSHKLPDDTLVIITSNLTDGPVKDLNLPNVQTVKVP